MDVIIRQLSKAKYSLRQDYLHSTTPAQRQPQSQRDNRTTVPFVLPFCHTVQDLRIGAIVNTAFEKHNVVHLKHVSAWTNGKTLQQRLKLQWPKPLQYTASTLAA